MPLLSKIYSFVSTFISSMILPSTEKGMASYLFGRFFENIFEGLWNFFYSICKWFLAFMDFLQYFIQKLIGLDYWLETSKDGLRTLDEATSEDIIFKFLYSDSVQKVFRALCAVFVILLIIFTIFQIVKSEWDFMTGDGKGGNSKAAIFRSSIKAIVLVLVFPILLVMGIVSSNAILASIVKAVGVDMSETFGGKIFAISAQPANKYRHYVDANTYLPTTDQITFYLNDNNQLIAFGDGPNDEYHQYIANYKTYLETAKNGRKVTINSIFDPLVPKNEEKFSGFCFRLEDDNQNFKYYFIKAKDDTRDDVYYYLTRCLGAQVLSKSSSWAYDEVGLELKDGIGSNFNRNKNDGCYIKGLNLHKGNSAVRQTARNSWDYSLVYVAPNKKLTQTISSVGNQYLTGYDLSNQASAVGAILYNSNHISAYFDGGQFGVVQSRAEYSVMADVVDFMCDNNLTFYIMDATSPLINWNYHYDKDGDGNVENDESYMVDSKWISKKVNRGANSTSEYYLNDSHATDIGGGVKGLTFLTKYSNNYALPAESEQDIIYTASFTAGNELEGSRYIICLRGDNCFFPLVNGEEISINQQEYTFKSPQYASEYRGVVWAKGTFDTNTVDGYYGNPTYLKNTSTFDNGIEKTTADADGAYYYRFVKTAGETGEIKLYTYYTQNVDGTLYTYNSGSIYKQDSISVTAGKDGDNNVTLKATGIFGTNSECTYTLKPTGKEFKNKNEYASAESGICYVVYGTPGGNLYKLNSDGDDLVPLNGSIAPNYLSSSGNKYASDLSIRTEKIENLNMNEADGQNVLKNQFSIFSDEEYVGTFTKKGLIDVGGLPGIDDNTKVFESNWGGKYYNIDVQGVVTRAATGGPLTGRFNDKLKVSDGRLMTMLLNFEATQASDSVTCYRNQIENYSGNSFACVLIEINVALFKAIFEIKTGIVQQVSDNPFASTTFTYAGANSGLTFDYFFDQNIKLRTFYSATKINYVLLLVSSVLIIKVLFSALWGVIKRFYMITFYYLAMPVAASTMPIDNGSRFGNIRNQITGEVLSTYGVLIGLNLFFVLLSPIREISSTIFTDEMIATSGSYFLKNLHISAKVLNEFIYILFLLVAFTLINELPSFVQSVVGKGQSLDKTGAQVKQSVGQTMRSATDAISGKDLKKSFNEVKQMAPGMIPGGALIGGAAKKTGEAIGEGAKKFAEGAKKAGGAIAGAAAGAAGGEGDMGDIAEGAMQGAQQAGGKDGKGGKGGAENSREIDAENAIGEDGNPLDDIAGDDKENPLDGNPLDNLGETVTAATGDPIAGAIVGELTNGEPVLDKDGNPIENAGPGGPGQGNMDENWVRSIVRDEMSGGKGGAENARSSAADPTMEAGKDGKDGKDGKLPFLATNIDPEKAKASKEEIAARADLKGHRGDLADANKDIMSAKAVLANPFASKEAKEEAKQKLEDAQTRKGNIKGEITKDKQKIEDSMSDERKAARRMQITNTIMSGVGTAATVAATIAGGPIAGILVHKTAKNLKKAAPGVVNASIEKFGELKTKAKEGVKAFKAADGLGKAEMISNFAMKGAGVAAKGALAATAIGFAAPVVLPALGAVNSVTSAVGVPLWAVGATALSGKLSKKFSGEGGAQGQGGGLISRIAAGKGRVVQAGAGGNVPEGVATQSPQTGAKPAGAENARQAGAQGAAKPKRNLEMTQGEKDARERFDKKKEELDGAKEETSKIKEGIKDKEKKGKAAQKALAKNNKEIADIDKQIDESDWDRSKESEGDYIKRMNKNKALMARRKALVENNEFQKGEIEKNTVTDKEKKNLEDAKDKEKKLKGEKSEAKKDIEKNMSDDRKSERRDRIANVVMNSVGAAGTVAATIAGGPIAGILVHKMAKNVKKAAPGVMNAAAQKFGEFKAADGWGRAEMISNLAMKGAKVAAVGVLAAPIAKFAAPALGAVNKLTSAVGAPLALIGGAALTGHLSKKFSGEGSSQGGGLISRIAASRGRVVQSGAGAEVPQGTTQQTASPVAGGKPGQAKAAASENARQTFSGPSEAEKQARSDLKDHKKELKSATNERKSLEKELLKGGKKEEDLSKEDQAKLKAARDKESDAKGKVTKDKQDIEKEMTPDRKAARRNQIANTVLSGLGTAGTIAGTIAGGPIVGLLIHKTAKNLKKAAPAVLNSAGQKFGALKTQLGEFKQADGLRKAEILTGMAMKGAKAATIGVLAAPVAKLALPVLGAVNKATSAIGVPLWAVGAAGLSGLASKKLNARMNSGASFVNTDQGRVVQAGAGGDIPAQPARPVAGGKVGAENARQSSAVKMPEMTQKEKEARENFGTVTNTYKEKKAAQDKIAANAKARNKIANDKNMSQAEKDKKLEALDADDMKQKDILGIDRKATDSQTKKAAKEAVKKAKSEKTEAKKEIEKNMSPERKAARRERISNIVMNSVGAAGTVAATIAGGPIMGLLMHKTAKNIKKAAPGVMNAAAKKFGEFKAADGWGKAEMISNLAMKGAGAAAVGVLAAPIAKFAAPALGAVNKLTSAVGAPLWALGAVGLTSAVGRRVSGGKSFIGSRRRFVQPGAGTEIPNDVAYNEQADVGYTTSPNTSVTRRQTVQETQNAFVYDESKIAEIVRKVIRGEDALRTPQDKMKAAAHIVNYGAVNDRNFVENKTDAYRNAIVNSIETRGGKVVVGDAINEHAKNAGVGVAEVMLHGYKGEDGKEVAGLVSDKNKIDIYKSMMTQDQLDTFNAISNDTSHKKFRDDNGNFKALEFIQANDGLGMKLGVTYNQERGVEFNVNGNTVRGKNAINNAGITSNDAASAALKEVMSSGAISSEDVVESIERTGYMSNTEKAIARNYALTIDYDKENDENSTNGYHKSVFAKARKDADINAEAIYEYIKGDEDKLKEFNENYHLNQYTGDEKVSKSIEAIKNNIDIAAPETVLGQARNANYDKELSQVISKRVGDDSFKVEAFELLTRKEQLNAAEHISANINAASTGVIYAYTDAEKSTKSAISRDKMGPVEMVNSVMNYNFPEKDQVVNNLVGAHFGMLDGSGNISSESENSKKMMAEINANEATKAKKEELIAANQSETDILTGYAKAKVVGDTANFDKYVGNNTHDKAVVEQLMKGDGSSETKEQSFDPTKPLTNSEFVSAAMSDKAHSSDETVNRLVMDSVGLTHTKGVIDVTSDTYKKLQNEMTKHEHWGNRLRETDLESSEAQQLVLGYAKAKVMNEHKVASKMDSYVGGNLNSRNQDIAEKIAKSSEIDSEKELEETLKDIDLYGNLSDKDVRDYATAESKQKKMHNDIKAAFGYVEGGDAKTNGAAERAMAKYINSNGQNQDLANMQGVNVNPELLARVTEKYFTSRGKNGLTLAQDITANAELMNSDSNERARIEKLFEMQNSGRTKAALNHRADELLDRAIDEKNTPVAGEFSVAGAKHAVKNLKEDYLTGDKSVSELNASVQGNFKAADVYNYFKQTLPPELFEDIKKDGAENAYMTRSSAEQEALVAKAAMKDQGARVVLLGNNIDISSIFDVSQFLNSSFGEALKERLIAKISQEISVLDLFADKLGVGDAGVYNLVSKQTEQKQDASVYEKAQGDLISMERVKARAESESSEGADNIAKNAASRMGVLSKDEREKVSVEATYEHIKGSDIKNKTAVLGSENVRVAEQTGIYESVKVRKAAEAEKVEKALELDESYKTASERDRKVKAAEAFAKAGLVDKEDRAAGTFAGKKEAIRLISESSEEGKRAVDIGAAQSRLSAYQSANEKAIAGGGLDRQRKVANSIWDDDDTRNLARARFRKENKGQELENLNEVDRNSYLFENYDKFLSPESEGRKKVDDIMRKSKVNLSAEASSESIIKNMNQTEFDTVVKGMKGDGDTAVSGIKKNIITDLNKDGALTEIPDTSKMTKEELKEFNDSKSQLEQHYRKNNNAEEFANLYRNTTLVNDDETLREILSKGNPNISPEKLKNARNEALRGNGDFMGSTIEAVLNSKGYEGILDKIKEYLKSNSNVDYDKLSTADRGKAIQELLDNKDFLKTSQVNKEKVKNGIEIEFDKRSATATNTDVKQGLSSEQILAFLRAAQGERTRDQLMQIGAHSPRHMFPPHHYHNARMHMVMHNPMMRRRMILSVLRRLYREPVLKRMIADEIASYDSKFKAMSKNEVRKYINNNFSDLAHKFGEKNIVQKDKNGNYSLNPSVNKDLVNNAVNHLERFDMSFSQKMKMFVKEAAKNYLGIKTDSGKDKDFDEFSRKLYGKLEGSSEFRGIVERITKPTIQQQIQEFFTKGSANNVILETSKRLADDTEYSKKVYQNANKETITEIRNIEARLNELKRMLKK